MAARWLEAKYLKIKKMKRELALQKPKQFHGVDTGKITSYEIFQNGARVQTTGGGSRQKNPDQMLPRQNNTFCQAVPERAPKEFTYNPEQEIDSTVPPKQVSKDGVRLVEHTIVERGWNPTPRGETQKRLRQEQEMQKAKLCGNYLHAFKVWQGVRGQGVITYTEHVLEDIPAANYTLRLIFQGPEFIFVQECKGQRWVSVTYRSLLEAKEAKDGSRITWALQEKIS